MQLSSMNGFKTPIGGTRSSSIAIAVITHVLMVFASPAFGSERWSIAEANAWYEKQPWLVGSNYNPATAINQLEMWQADTFDPETIDKEFGWARALGMNT